MSAGARRWAWFALALLLCVGFAAWLVTSQFALRWALERASERSGGRFVVVGQTDGLADFDPGPGTDIVDRGAVTFASRYSF